MLYCFLLAEVLLCMDPAQDGRVCVVGGGVERKLCDICDIDQALYPTTKRISFYFTRDIARKKVAFQLQLSLKF